MNHDRSLTLATSIRPLVAADVPSMSSRGNEAFPKSISGVSNVSAALRPCSEHPDKNPKAGKSQSLSIHASRRQATESSVIWRPPGLREKELASTSSPENMGPDESEQEIGKQAAPALTLSESIPARNKYETCMAYVRRLKRMYPDLTAREAAAISGAQLSNLRQMPEFLPMTAAAAAAIAAIPARAPDETAASYVYRLKQTTPDLPLKDTAVAVGINTGHVRRLWDFSPRSRARSGTFTCGWALQNRRLTTQGAGCPLGLVDVPGGSGHRVSANSLLSHARQISSIETRSSGAQAGVKNPTAVIHRDAALRRSWRGRMATSESSDGSAPIASPTRPAAGRQTPEMAQANNAASEPSETIPMTHIPARRQFESGMAYARRLKMHLPDLSIYGASALSGVALTHIRYMPEFSNLTPMAKAAVDAIAPRGDTETATAYASRLKTREPRLTIKDAAIASGARIAKIRSLPEFVRLSETARSAIGAISPRGIGESSLAYARRLKKGTPALSARDAANASGAYVCNVRRTPEFLRERGGSSAVDTKPTTSVSSPASSHERQSVAHSPARTWSCRRRTSTPVDAFPRIPRTSALSASSEEQRGLSLSSREITDIGSLLLRRKGVSNNQLGDLAPWLLVASPHFPANITIRIEEWKSDGGMQVYTVYSANDPRASQQPPHQITLGLQRASDTAQNDSDAKAHYSYQHRDGEFISLPADGDCFYSAVAEGLHQCGLSRFSVGQLRNMTADAFEANPAQWLSQTDQQVLLSELRQARAATAGRSVLGNVSAEDNVTLVSQPDDEDEVPDSPVNDLLLNRRHTTAGAPRQSWRHASRWTSSPSPSRDDSKQSEQAFRVSLCNYLRTLPEKIRSARAVKQSITSDSGLQSKAISDYFCEKIEDRIAAMLTSISTKSVRDMQSAVVTKISSVLESEIQDSKQEAEAMVPASEGHRTLSHRERMYRANHYAQSLQTLINEMEGVLWDGASAGTEQLPRNEGGTDMPAFSQLSQPPVQKPGPARAEIADETYGAPPTPTQSNLSSPRHSGIRSPGFVPQSDQHIEMQLQRGGVSATVKWPLHDAASCSSLLLNWMR